MSSLGPESSTITFSATQYSPEISQTKSIDDTSSSFPEEQSSSETYIQHSSNSIGRDSSHLMSSKVSTQQQDQYTDTSTGVAIYSHTDEFSSINSGHNKESIEKTKTLDSEQNNSDQFSSINNSTADQNVQSSKSPIQSSTESTPTLDDFSNSQNVYYNTQQSPDIHINPQLYDKFLQESVQNKANSLLKTSHKSGPLMQKLHKALIELEKSRSIQDERNFSSQIIIFQSQMMSQSAQIKPKSLLEYNTVEEIFEAEDRFYKYSIVDPQITIISPDLVENDVKIIQILGGILRLHYMEEQTYFVGFLK